MAWRVEDIEPGDGKAVVELDGIVDSTNLEEFFSFKTRFFNRVSTASSWI